MFAADYEVNRVREDTLLLLHNCGQAVFDVTSRAGQYTEIEKALDYGVECLLVCNSMDSAIPSHVSGMLPKRPDVQTYRTLDELKTLVREWLSGGAK